MGRGYSGNHPRFSGKQDERYDAKEAYNKDLTASARLHYLENDRHDHESPAHSHCSPMRRHTDAHMRRQAKRIARKTKGDEQDIYYEMKSKKMNDERSKGKNEFDQEKLQEEMDRMIDERGGNVFGKTSAMTPKDMYDSPFNSGHERTVDYFTKRNDEPFYDNEHARALDSVKSNKYFFSKNRDLKKALDKGDDERANQIKIDLQNFGNTSQAGFINEEHQSDLQEKQDVEDERTRALIEKYKRENNITRRSSSPMKMEGKGCAKSEGGSGCVVKRGGEFVILNNKKGGVWRSGFASKAAADKVLSAYHANK
tara:strand:+ start:3971 stop:4906 length:936 start_codon:yes stop_codon:yes gene_type:complete